MRHPLEAALDEYAGDVIPLAASGTTTEGSYYPPIRTLLQAALSELSLPPDVRAATSEARARGGTDLPDLALYDGGGDFVVVCCEVKTPDAVLSDMAVSTGRNDQIGRYLAQTGVVLLCNVRGFGLLTRDPSFEGEGPVPPEYRRLEQIVELWPSPDALRTGQAPDPAGVPLLSEIVEGAVTRHAPIAQPETLARILAVQARRAKEALPTRFSQAVSSLAEDFGEALGITFEGEEGEEFFRSSLVQTVYYGLFAGWLLWARQEQEDPFEWRRLPEYLRIPFLGELFYEIQHPRRIAELDLEPRLDLASETLGRVNRDRFFKLLELPMLGDDRDPEQAASTAIVYFYEPFLETFDPKLRKELGVWYTPPEIVRYQVRKVDQLLRDELDCPRGFADERVVVLDPCCGTGAYLIEVLHCMAETLRSEGVKAELGATLLHAVHERVLGFEILTAPFVISHLQLHLILASLGAEPTHEERPGVFLTNALTGWHEGHQIKLNFPELQEEHDAARRAKEEAPIIVLLGNPPYNRFAGAPVAEEQTLADRYKGIRRDEKGRQVKRSELYRRWGIRKHLLDDLYIRFFRLAEERIAEVAGTGIVSLISNSSYLTGRSHPLMREHLVTGFDDIWIDNLNGDKYKTGKLIPAHEPGAGTADQSIFSTARDPGGIQVGTAIATLLKRPSETDVAATVSYRDFWGLAVDKRAALLRSLQMSEWTADQGGAAARRPEGPRPYQLFTPEERRRWKLVPYEVMGGYDDWYSLDELFPTYFQGVNPNRGIHGSVIDVDAAELEKRMQDFFSDLPFSEIQARYPALCQDRAGYEAQATRTELRRQTTFSRDRIVPYLLFPLDSRYLYYETTGRLLNRSRPELADSLHRTDNEFLVAVPEPRKISEALPLYTTTAFDLHVHDRGSVGFPAEVSGGSENHGLFADAADEQARRANLNPRFWEVLAASWKMDGELDSESAFRFVRKLFRVCLALSHAPQYQDDHRESLAHDWAHVPLPKDRVLFEEVAETGHRVATLLDPSTPARTVIEEILDQAAAGLAVLDREGGGPVRETDLAVTISYYGAARGRWHERDFVEGEPTHKAWGDTTGDLYINDEIFFRNVPERVWGLELGGYPVLKKWLGYRRQRYRNGEPLALEEKDAFREIVSRLAALLVLHPRLDELYERAAADAWLAQEAEAS